MVTAANDSPRTCSRPRGIISGLIHTKEWISPEVSSFIQIGRAEVGQLPPEHTRCNVNKFAGATFTPFHGDFGAHTYERVDKPRGEFFHTNWTGRGGTTTARTYTV